MGYEYEQAVLNEAVDIFGLLVTGLTASLTGPIPSSLSQYATDTAELVEPLLDAATAVTDAVATVTAGLDTRVTNLETRMTNLEARVTTLETKVANHETRIAALEAAH